MQFALIKNSVVQNVIVADADFVQQIASDFDHIEPLDTLHEQGLGVGVGWTWDGQFHAPAVPELPTPVVYTKLTKRAFQERFPLTSNGISRKYDRMDLFLRDDGYAASLGVTGAAMYELRLTITTGVNRLNASAHVDYAIQDAANFLQLLTLPAIPEAFRLTAAERTKMLEDPITEAERFTA